MEAGHRVSRWSNAALWFGVVALVLATLAAIPHHLNGKPWWEHDDPAEAQNALAAGTSLATALIVAATVVGVVGISLGLVGIRHYLTSRITSPGRVVGLGRACTGLLLSGNAASVLVYAAVKQMDRADPLVFVALPAVLSLLTAWQAYRWWRRNGMSTLAALTPAESDAASDGPKTGGI